MPTLSWLIWPPLRALRLAAPEARQLAGREAFPRRRRRARRRRGPAPAASSAGLLAQVDSCACLLSCLQRGDRVGAGGALAWAAAGERGEALGLQAHRLQLGALPLRRVEEVAAHGAAGAERLRPRHVARGVIAAQRDEAGAAAGQL